MKATWYYLLLIWLTFNFKISNGQSTDLIEAVSKEIEDKISRSEQTIVWKNINSNYEIYFSKILLNSTGKVKHEQVKSTSSGKELFGSLAYILSNFTGKEFVVEKKINKEVYLLDIRLKTSGYLIEDVSLNLTYEIIRALNYKLARENKETEGLCIKIADLKTLDNYRNNKFKGSITRKNNHTLSLEGFTLTDTFTKLNTYFNNKLKLEATGYDHEKRFDFIFNLQDLSSLKSSLIEKGFSVITCKTEEVVFYVKE